MNALDGIQKITDIDLKAKKLFLRLDLNVPLDGNRIVDDLRIKAALPTIQYAIEAGAKIMLCSHLGRPKEKGDPSCSLEPVAVHLSELLKKEVVLVEDPEGDGAKALINGLTSNQILLLENIRYASGETKNDEKLAEHFASFVDVYINDAFGASHRAHASIKALAEKVPVKGIGFLMEKELSMLGRLLEKPESPYVAVMGGSKVSDKIDLIQNLMDKVDSFIIGGAMSYTFLAAKGIPVGSSRIESEKIGFARDLIERIEGRGKKILLPVDHIAVKEFKADAQITETPTDAIPEGMMAVDIGPKTRTLFTGEIRQAKTLLWNGPMGVYEMDAFAKGSLQVARAFADSEGFSVIGGGDSAAVVNSTDFADKMDHISTGGGASLEYLQGDDLPGLAALRS